MIVPTIRTGPIAVEHHEPTIVDVGVRAINAAKAIFERPLLTAIVDRRRHGPQDPFLIVRMDSVAPPFDRTFGGVVRLAKTGPVALVSPEAVLAQVPIPDSVLRGGRDHLKPLLAFAQLLFGLLACVMSWPVANRTCCSRHGTAFQRIHLYEPSLQRTLVSTAVEPCPDAN